MAPLTTGGARLPESFNFVYFTPDYYFAWAYAYASGVEGMPRVYLVDPLSQYELDPEQSAHMNAYRAKAARVLVDVGLEAPFSEAVALAGWKAATENPGETVKLFAGDRHK